jgi:hypothetical protein
LDSNQPGNTGSEPESELSSAGSDFSLGSGGLDSEHSGEVHRSSSESYFLSDLSLDADDEQSSFLSSTGVPLYGDSCISSSAFNVAFLSLVQRHNLTYSSHSDILRLVSIVLPAPNAVPSSSNALIKEFSNFGTETSVQRFCGCCTSLLSPGSFCTGQVCLRSREQSAVFVRVPLTAQISERFQEPYSISFPV